MHLPVQAMYPFSAGYAPFQCRLCTLSVQAMHPSGAIYAPSTTTLQGVFARPRPTGHAPAWPTLKGEALAMKDV
eukprot:81385-Chlamydomonas_euryale.AAC.1